MVLIRLKEGATLLHYDLILVTSSEARFPNDVLLFGGTRVIAL